MFAAVCSAAISLPHRALAQNAGATSSARTWDFALTGSRASEPFDHGYAGVSAQYTANRGRWWWFGAQAGALGNPFLAEQCDVAPGVQCNTAPTGRVYLSPLGGVGVRKGPLLLRATAGPRITVNSSSPLRGAQASGELALGNDRGALYIPFTWSRSRHYDQSLELRTIGIGIQVR